MPIFDHAHPKIIEINFSFLEFASVCKKSVHFIYLILEIQSILESHDQTGQAHFLTTPAQKNFDQLLFYLTLYEHAKNQAISLICSGDMID